jgi:uncharacterized protein YbaR (Trm112 family)
MPFDPSARYGGHSPQHPVKEHECVCPTCQSVLLVSEKAIGMRLQCPKCKQPLTIPELIPEVLPADPLEVLPADQNAPRLDSRGRYRILSCSSCGRQLRVPAADSGKILSCPSCLFFYKVPGKLRSKTDGLPVHVLLSALQVQWPLACACCLESHDAFVPVSHAKFDWSRASSVLAALDMIASAQVREARIPYCWECIEHVKRNDESLCKRKCPVVKCAFVYEAWHGTEHLFRFFNWRYANEFLRLNADKIAI